MRARDFVYHLHCFSCASCNKALTKGEQFGMKENMVYCRHHYESLHVHHHHHLMANYTSNAVSGATNPPNAGGVPTEEDTSSPTALFVRTPPSPGHHHHHHHHHHQGAGAGRMPYYNGVGTVQKGRPRKKKVMDNQPEVHNITGLGPGQTLDLLGNGGPDLCSLESSGGSGAYDTNPSTPNSSSTGGQSQARTKRMRTSFKHHQLRTMKSYFALNQNPDAKDLKQLAQKTGLSKRVLQVWFQNARAKWRRNMIRQEGQLGDKGPSSVDPSNCNSTVNDLVTGVGGGVGGGSHLGAPLSTTPSSMGDISGGTLTSDSQSPPSLTFGDLY
ncbi:LIM/homeobox protein Lhx9 [Chamberlinius hualienensis]